ncbi:hypothetical protein [Sphingomonas colocasiae]|uniref:Uncharacterized protein n=1 Tax=Sphingomonas colocasiae TaxID=1848973 RepID=A0ABS7PR82_9SPHN|nr:hypothetical protein [Sphingomonas colocasiae]MBY8823852.1 hypothetical protein [Sphingomonas colocasiae]
MIYLVLAAALLCLITLGLRRSKLVRRRLGRRQDRHQKIWIEIKDTDLSEGNAPRQGTGFDRKQ